MKFSIQYRYVHIQPNPHVTRLFLQHKHTTEYHTNTTDMRSTDTVTVGE